MVNEEFQQTIDYWGNSIQKIIIKIITFLEKFSKTDDLTPLLICVYNIIPKS